MSVGTAAPVAANLLESTVDALWRQWRAIGGAAAGGPASTQVDPETLCIASLVLEPHEPRLWTVMIDWLRLASALVSVQRLKNLNRQFAVPEDSLERFASAVAEEMGETRFKALLPARRKATRGRDGRTRSLGFKQRSGGPALETGPALLLRLRAAFGVGVKADLLAFLLGQRFRVSVSTAASALVYSAPTVFRAFQDLQMAGFARSTASPAAVEYWVDAVRWSAFLGGDSAHARWGHWWEILLYVCAVLRWEEQSKRRAASEYARGASLREVAVQHESDLARAGLFEDGLAFPKSPALEEWRAFHRGLAQTLTSR